MSQSQPDPPDPPAPRMSIAHIMLLTLTTAISIAVMNWISQRWAVFVSPRAPDPVLDVLVVAARLWRAGMLGMELALAAIVLMWIVRQRPRGIAPGHWILLGLGAEAVVGMAMSSVAVLTLPGDGPYHFSQLWRLGFLASCEFMLTVLWFALAVTVWNSSWKLLFALEGTLNLLSAAGFSMMALGPGNLGNSAMFGTAIGLIQIGQLGGGVSGIIGVVLAILDRRTQRRDWLHVLGVTLMFLRIVSSLMYYFVPGM